MTELTGTEQALTASPRPHECVILAIDPGATSGWAVMSPTAERSPKIVLADSGSARTAEERCAVVLRATRESRAALLPLVVCAEKWTAHGAFGGARTQRGLGAAWGRWSEQIESAGIAKRRVIRCYPQTWQGAILSAGGRGWTRERREAASIAYVAQRFGIECGADEAAAICIGAWAMHASEVAAVLPKRKAAR